MPYKILKLFIFNGHLCGNREHVRAKGHEIGNAILKTFCFLTFFLERILQSQITVEKEQFRAFFRMVLQKLSICGKRGCFRSTNHAILKTFYFITFFLGDILQSEMTVEKVLFRAFFRVVPLKMAICGKRGHFRATSTSV